MHIFNQLLDATISLIGAESRLAEFAVPPAASLEQKEVAAHELPVTGMLNTFSALSVLSTAPLVRAILQAAPLFRWQQSYSKAQVGAAYLSKYGWFNLVSPDGLYGSEEIRLSFGVWGQGLTYPTHWHEPQEAYLVLAGGALFHAQGRPARQCRPGDVVYHASNQPHSMDMAQTPLMALAIWKGGALLRKPDLDVQA